MPLAATYSSPAGSYTPSENSVRTLAAPDSAFSEWYCRTRSPGQTSYVQYPPRWKKQLPVSGAMRAATSTNASGGANTGRLATGTSEPAPAGDSTAPERGRRPAAGASLAPCPSTCAEEGSTLKREVGSADAKIDAPRKQ
eukprot:scaffold14455_cov111-Isochrysis_galbana.AAC.2